MSFLSKLFGKPDSPIKITQNVVRTVIPLGTNPDQAIIEQLRKVGFDLSTPLHIRHIFIMPTKDAANQIGEELKARSLIPETTEEGGRWKVAAGEEMVLEESSIAAKRADFSNLAGNFGGKYAGWEMKTIRKASFKIG